MNAYASEYPSVEFDPAFKQFFEDFYATSDTPDAHNKYTTFFTKDATLIMASKQVKGCEGTSPINSSRVKRSIGRRSDHSSDTRETDDAQ